MSVLNFGWLRRLRALVMRRRVEREVDEEMRFHVEMEAAELQRVYGLAPEVARRQALLAFGGVERHWEAGRDARGIAWLSSTSLDFRLGLRMLRKHAALSVIGGLGMAVAIAIATGFFTFTTSFYYSHPPLADGARIVAVENRNLRNSEDWRASLFDYHTWREELTSVTQLAAFRPRRRNLHVPGGAFEPVQVAEMTASGFGVARVPPLLGRLLIEADEQAGAAPVVVIGHDEWQRLFAADPGVIGREVRLGGTAYQVVGVMPEGFRFPNNFGVWTALPASPSRYGPGAGPRIVVFGRLAPGVGKERAQAELTAFGRRMAATHPDVYEHLRPTIVRYVHVLLDVQQYPAWLVWLMQLFGILLLTVVAVNVAVLVYARTAARHAEITVRTALGAGRERIVGQLFLEALVLCVLAAALGLLIAHVGYRQLVTLAGFETMLPYWIGQGLSRATLPYAVGLAVLAAFLVGVLPALRATGRDLQSALRRMDTGGEIPMGATWTLLIVVQVAIAVAVLPTVVAIAANSIWKPLPTPTFAVDELLWLRPGRDEETLPPSGPQLESSYVTQRAELLRRVEAEPGVAGVTFELNGAPCEGRAGVTTDCGLATPGAAVVQLRCVDVDYFDVYGIALLAGRRFETTDVGGTGVIVSRAFVQRFLGGGPAIGRTLRKTGPTHDAAEPAYHIIGVVDDMYVHPTEPERTGVMLYQAATSGAGRLGIAVRARGATPAELAPRVQQIAREVAPDWQVNIAPMRERSGALDERTIRFVALIVGVMTASVLLLSAAGISALMSFAVTRRQREIGIRAALGAPRDRIVASIFARSARQLALGLVVGAAAAAALDRASGGELLGGRAVILLPLVAVLMVLAGLLATLGPARRALRVHPMEALRQD